MKKLDVQLNEEAILKVFMVIDEDGCGMIEKGEFLAFFTSKHDTDDLQESQIRILEAVGIQNLFLHQR